MQATAAIQLNHQHIVVSLDAVELGENRIICSVSGPPRIRTSTGDEYSVELTEILCISGMAIARRKLHLPKGLAITVSEVRGLVDKAYEPGVCVGAAVAIARALDKAPSLLHDSMEGWQLVD
ncbi:MAG: hypothetical protein V4719_25390 [Planctomycetota bacterium]